MDVINLKNGVLVINKPKNMTSRQVVDQAGKIFHTRKIGHTGTLDPLAEGVLVLGINQGTKIIELLTSTEKEYIAEVVMGKTSDTLDVTGNVDEVPLEKTYTKEEIIDCLNSFLGSYMQEVPIYSAVHIDGKRLYEYARENKEVTLPKREVTISKIELVKGPIFENNEWIFSFKVTVSKGTYIRSLIRDIGEKLNTPCIMKNLLRTRQGNFTLEQAVSLEDLTIDTEIIKTEDALYEYDKIEVPEEMEIKIKNGRVMPKTFEGKYIIFLNKQKELLAIYQEYEKDKSFMKPWKVFQKENEK